MGKKITLATMAEWVSRRVRNRDLGLEYVITGSNPQRELPMTATSPGTQRHEEPQTIPTRE